MTPDLLRQYAKVMREEGLTQLALKDDAEGEVTIVMAPQIYKPKPMTEAERQAEDDYMLFASSEGFPGETESGSHG